MTTIVNLQKTEPFPETDFLNTTVVINIVNILLLFFFLYTILRYCAPRLIKINLQRLYLFLLFEFVDVYFYTYFCVFYDQKVTIILTIIILKQTIPPVAMNHGIMHGHLFTILFIFTDKLSFIYYYEIFCRIWGRLDLFKIIVCIL